MPRAIKAQVTITEENISPIPQGEWLPVSKLNLHAGDVVENNLSGQLALVGNTYGDGSFLVFLPTMSIVSFNDCINLYKKVLKTVVVVNKP